MLKKLATGEYSLKATFWVFGLLGFLLFNIMVNITQNGVLRAICNGRKCSKNIVLYILTNFPVLMTNSRNGVMLALGIHLILSACFVCYMILVVRGIWKSSAVYEGHKFWSMCAKFITIIVLLLSLKSII